VGRDELCKVVIADLHDRGTRPHVLVGGVGTGKTTAPQNGSSRPDGRYQLGR
jgi:hypothetical protein